MPFWTSSDQYERVRAITQNLTNLLPQIYTVIQAVHSLLYIVAKCNFFSVVTRKDIIKYLQKCEGCTHFCEIYIYIYIYIYMCVCVCVCVCIYIKYKIRYLEMLVTKGFSDYWHSIKRHLTKYVGLYSTEVKMDMQHFTIRIHLMIVSTIKIKLKLKYYSKYDKKGWLFCMLL